MASNGNQYHIVEIGPDKSKLWATKKERELDGWVYVALFADPTGVGPVIHQAVFAKPENGVWTPETRGEWLSGGRRGKPPSKLVKESKPVPERGHHGVP